MITYDLETRSFAMTKEKYEKKLAKIDKKYDKRISRLNRSISDLNENESNFKSKLISDLNHERDNKRLMLKSKRLRTAVNREGYRLTDQDKLDYLSRKHLRSQRDSGITGGFLGSYVIHPVLANAGVEHGKRAHNISNAKNAVKKLRKYERKGKL